MTFKEMQALRNKHYQTNNARQFSRPFPKSSYIWFRNMNWICTRSEVEKLFEDANTSISEDLIDICREFVFEFHYS